MKFDKQDPRITAYALGEPLNEADQAFIDSIKTDGEFTELVNEIESSVDVLKNLFQQEDESINPVEINDLLDTNKPKISFWSRIKRSELKWDELWDKSRHLFCKS